MNDVKYLLKKIFLESQKQSSAINSKQFRAQNHEYLDILDQMEKEMYLENIKDTYFIRLGTLPYIKDIVGEVSTVMKHCQKIFKILYESYKNDLEKEITIEEITKKTNISKNSVITAVFYLKQSHILCGYSTDLRQKGAFIKPSESVLKHKSFSEIVDKAHADLVKYNDRVESEEELEMEYDEEIQHFEQLIHPVIAEHSLQQYYDGYLKEAVFNSILAVFDLIRERTGLDEDGDKLIGKVFSLENPSLIFSNLDTVTGRDDQKGFMQILKGVYQGIRSPKAHRSTHDLTNLKAARYLVLASLLAQRIKDAEFAKKVVE